jgi:L-fucose mutarotase
MLKGVSPLIGPDLLAILHRMGHGDEIVLADAHFPGESVGRRLVRADGLRIADLLEGILPLIALDTYGGSPTIMMAPDGNDVLDPSVEESYRRVILKHYPTAPPMARDERFAFYERAKKAFAVVMTGETAAYGNIILRKGVTPC